MCAKVQSSNQATERNKLQNSTGIPSGVCKRDESVAAANIRQRKLATDFMEKLNTFGYSTRCFDPAGQDDIGGGCGQLWFVQEWMRNNPILAKPSIGRTIPIVHTPC